MGTLRGHDDEVLDVSFDYTGQYLLTASADSTARVYNATTHQMLSTLEGHEGEISKVSFNRHAEYIAKFRSCEFEGVLRNNVRVCKDLCCLNIMWLVVLIYMCGFYYILGVD